jgi:hypothetical protein
MTDLPQDKIWEFGGGGGGGVMDTKDRDGLRNGACHCAAAQTYHVQILGLGITIN